MPRVRGMEMAPRVSTRGPGSNRLSGSNSDPSHHRAMTKQSPKVVGDRRSPRSVSSEPLTQKRLGTRIAGLETQLEQAQGELKLLKDQLASAQKEIDKKGIMPPSENQEDHETDVFEVPMVSQTCDQDEVKVKVKVKVKDNIFETLSQENEDLKHKLSEANVKISSSMVNEEKLTKELTLVDQELTKSKSEGLQLKEKLKEMEGAKEALEVEMKKLRVQTEQWRKAADAAAAILSGGVEIGEGRRVSERCGSMDKNYGGGVFEGFVGFPGLGDDSDDGFGNNEKRKGSGIRVFGDLWKKKGHK